MTGDKRQTYLLDTEAAALGYYAVLDINYKVVSEFETLKEAEEFIAENNQIGIDQAKHDNRVRGELLQEYRKNMRNKT